MYRNALTEVKIDIHFPFCRPYKMNMTFRTLPNYLNRQVSLYMAERSVHQQNTTEMAKQTYKLSSASVFTA